MMPGQSRHKLIAFGLLVYERMLPQLMKYWTRTQRDAAVFLDARDVAWKALEGASQGVEWSRLASACESALPDIDAEDVAIGGASFALNTGLAALELMELLADGQPGHAEAIGSLAKESLFMYAQALGSCRLVDREAAGRIAAHPLLEEERSRQKDDLEFISALPDIMTAGDLSALKERARMQAVLPIVL